MITNKQELFTALRRKGDEIKISSISSDLLKDKDVIRGIASNYAPLIKPRSCIRKIEFDITL